MKKLVIVPAYNEEKSIHSVVETLRHHAPDWDILIVNDCSRDNTEEQAVKLNVFVVSLPINLGIGGAVQTGFKWAIKNKYDLAIQFDGDGQHKAEYIDLIASPVLANEVDLCVGSRFTKNYTEFETIFARRCGMIIFSWYYLLLTGNRITDTTSGFRCYSKKVMQYYFYNYPVDFPDMPVLFAAKKNNFRIREVAVTMNQRQFGVSSTNFWKSIFYPLRTIIASLAVYLSGKEESKHD